METRCGQYTISTHKLKLDVSMVHEFLSQEAYWALGRSRDAVERSIASSICFGVYDPNDRQVGFARAITDQATFAWIADLFILPEARGRGLAKGLMGAISGHPDLRDVRRWLLATRDAHALYTGFGFEPLPEPGLYMVRVPAGPLSPSPAGHAGPSSGRK
ncbi:MAG TPA: GNAT family N-acetyltransferase [Polyangiaceae bacterium]|jgi:GNAT superfamily N-acetyltransferase|nr:GNAT family N-acetyltransferase [Polyangiaceae bacterium]